jgi:hypothetical protein
MENTARANLTPGLNARYCSCCGKEVDKCECPDSNITISICVPRELLSGLSNLTRLIPKIQVSTDRCNSCGHTLNRCTCDDEKK